MKAISENQSVQGVIPNETPKPQTVDGFIDLRDVELVNQGGRRFVYLIPRGFPGFEDIRMPLALKVPKYKERLAQINWVKRLLTEWIPYAAERVIRVEAAYFTRLAHEFTGPIAEIPLPQFFGFARTSQGRAALWEAICDDQGRLAPTLHQLIERGQVHEFLEPLNKFVKFCYRNNVLAPDIQVKNLVLAHRNGGKQVVLVDGFGDMRLISKNRLSRKQNTALLDRRFRRVARTTGLEFDAKEQAFSRPIDG